MSALFRRHCPVSDEIYSKIEQYHALLLKWQKAINLVSPKTIPEAWERHFLDSAQIEPLLPRGPFVLADLGCGGGFPGLVIAMMRPDITVHLVESDERKGQFMRTVSRETVLTNVKIHTKRIEDVTQDFQPDLVTARALASLRVLLEYIKPWSQSNTALQALFLKGKGAEDEVADALRIADFKYKFYDSLTEPQARIVCVHDIQNR